MLGSLLLLGVVFCVFYIVHWIRKKTATDPLQGKQPPIVSGPIPFIRAGLSWIRSPTTFLNEQRAIVGDTFVLEAFGLKLFFTFSAKGLSYFYQIPETNASFTEATRGFLGFKVTTGK
jgi:hypothetical protein